MDKKIIIIITALAVLVAGCDKNRFDHASSPAQEHLTVALSLDDATKDGIGGIFFPDAPNSGAIILNNGYFTVMSVPVNADGTLDWTLYLSDYPHDAYSRRDKTFSRVICSETGRTTEEWFANDKGYGCVFFATISGTTTFNSSAFVNYYRVCKNEETGGFYTEQVKPQERVSLFPDSGSDATGHAKNILVDGEKYYMATFMSNNAWFNYPSTDYEWEEYGIIDSAAYDHIVGAHSDVVFFSDIAQSKFLNFSSFAPAGTQLRFNMNTTEETLSLSRLEIFVENTGDNLSGQAYMDFSDYENNRYSLVSARHLSSVIGVDLENATYVTTYYLQDDGTYAETYDYIAKDEFGNPKLDEFDNPIIEYSTGSPSTGTANRTYDYRYRNDWYVYDPDQGEYRYQSPLTLTTTPTANYFYFGILPQQTDLSADSRIVFKAFNSNNQCVGIVRKKLPSGGFKGGVRYDFTLTFPHVGMEVDTDWSGAGTYYQGGQITED